MLAGREKIMEWFIRDIVRDSKDRPLAVLQEAEEDGEFSYRVHQYVYDSDGERVRSDFPCEDERHAVALFDALGLSYSLR